MVWELAAKLVSKARGQLTDLVSAEKVASVIGKTHVYACLYVNACVNLYVTRDQMPLGTQLLPHPRN